MGQLDGRVAIVTGGYRGLGLGMSQGLRDAGAQVSMWARDVTAMRPVAERMDAQAVACDVRTAGDVDRALSETLDRFGRVDVLVANAGRSSAFKSFLEITEEDWRDIMATNLDGVFRTCQAVARHMVDQAEGGKIVVITSIRAARGAPHAPAYGASKTGLEGLVRSMAVSLAEHSIQVNAIRPGWMESDMTERLRANEDLSRNLIRQVPAGRWGRPADLSGVITYLASSASDFHTGDVMTIDGGMSAGDPADTTTLFFDATA